MHTRQDRHILTFFPSVLCKSIDRTYGHLIGGIAMKSKQHENMKTKNMKIKIQYAHAKTCIKKQIDKMRSFCFTDGQLHSPLFYSSLSLVCVCVSAIKSIERIPFNWRQENRKSKRICEFFSHFLCRNENKKNESFCFFMQFVVLIQFYRIFCFFVFAKHRRMHHSG